jgi:hypothetical protein
MEKETQERSATWGDAFNGVRGETALQKAYARATDFRQLVHRLPGRAPFMLDRDVAAVYGVPTKQLMKQARRNMDRLDGEMLFQLTEHEYEQLKATNAYANATDDLRFQNDATNGISSMNRVIPFGFTQLGANKIAFYLRSEAAQERATQILKAFIHFEDLHKRGELGGSGNIGQGLMLSGAIQNQGLSLPDVAAICWFRQKGLTQKEVGTLMGSTQWKIQAIESILGEVGVKFKPVHAQARAGEIWRAFSRLMGFKNHVLPLLKKGGVA